MQPGGPWIETKLSYYFCIVRSSRTDHFVFFRCIPSFWSMEQEELTQESISSKALFRLHFMSLELSSYFFREYPAFRKRVACARAACDCRKRLKYNSRTAASATPRHPFRSKDQCTTFHIFEKERPQQDGYHEGHVFEKHGRSALNPVVLVEEGAIWFT